MKFAACLVLAVALLGPEASALAWTDYQIIQWQARNETQLATLKRLGVTAGTVIANRDGSGTPIEQQTAPLRAAGLRWYVENIATDFYSAYHRWFPNRAVNWRFIEVQRRYRANPADEQALWRDPSLVDPVWQRNIRDRLVRTVREQVPFHPLYYNLGDETGIADLSAFWDFDFSPGSLAGMRDWLRHGYGSLASLNAEWGTHFAHWRDVRPETTGQAMQRSDDNFAAWADFKAWMDVAFARALRMGTDAVHTADRSALAGIEGAQLPGWGGYDYTLLADAVDVMELDALPIAHSLNPRLIALTTSFHGNPRDIHAIWQDLLRGSRGLVLWDSNNSIVGPDGTLGERGRAYAATFAELRSGIGALIIGSQPRTDDVAILYSPASFRAQWMLDQKPKGDAWMTRSAEDELGGNAVRDAMQAYARSLAHIGLQPAYVSPAMLERGALLLRGCKLLILPHAIALSREEVRAIRSFAAHGGVVIADTQPGLFDQHSRRAATPPDMESLAIVPPDDMASLSRHVARAGVVPAVQVNGPNTDVETHIFRHGNEMIVALQRDFAETAPDEAVVLTLPRVADVYDIRKQQKLGRTDRLTLTLDAVAPALLSLQ